MIGTRLHKKTMARFGKSKSAERTASINDCFRPSLGASKADLVEFHAEDMKLRRSHQRKRISTYAYPIGGSIAEGNRHGGPHQHRREIERNRRRRAA